MLLNDPHIPNLEQDKQWQLTAVDENKNAVVIMRGSTSDPHPHFKKNYYTVSGGEIGYELTLEGLRNWIETGKLKLLRGTVPDAEAT
jgi:hypothetical protein